MKRKIVLDGSWQLFCGTEETVADLECCLLAGSAANGVEAIVPGSFELDLMRAGLLEDPFYGDRVLKLEEYEYMHFFYSRTFMAEKEGVYDLVLEGIDTYATVYLNGQRLGDTDNMFLEYRYPVTLCAGENRLLIHIRPTVVEARKVPAAVSSTALMYNYDMLPARKSPHMFGWDIAPRMISAGIWRSVYLEEPIEVGFRQSYIHTAWLEQGRAMLAFFYDVELAGKPAAGFRLEVDGVYGESTFHWEDRLWSSSGKSLITVDAPRLWWPKGEGEPALYRTTARLWREDTLCDEQHFTVGIRTVKLLNSEVLDEQGHGEFAFEINGRRLFICGTNWVPTDAIPARADTRVADTLALVEEIGCRMIRVWGGGHYESQEFYDLCDQKGILVWQDFMMACAVYPQDAAYCQRIEQETQQVVRRLRQHPSIVLWAGDNECDDMNPNPDQNRLTRQIIPQVLQREDPTRPYLPSSPYHSPKAGVLTEQHLWGDRVYYKADFYAKTPALFASEMGYHGCPAPASIRTFIEPAHCWPWQNDRQWLVHATAPAGRPDAGYGARNAMMANQIQVLFGEIPEDLHTFALASQISQAEALKFFIEQFRRRKGESGGILWWNIRDCWPQISDAVVDYYGRKKLAFGYIQRAQQTVCLMLDEQEPDACGRCLIAVNDGQEPCELRYRIRCQQDVLYEGETVLPADSRTVLNTVALPEENRLLLIEWEGAATGRNTYLTGVAPYDLEAYCREADAYGLLTTEGF